MENNEVEDLVAKSFELVQRKIFCYSKAIYIIKMTTVINSMKVFFPLLCLQLLLLLNATEFM